MDEARAAVRRDLAGQHEAILVQCVERRRWWVEQWPDGRQYLTGLLAQDVQEALHHLNPTWPLCPEHRDHRLYVEPDLGTDPFWVCEVSGLPIAPVGHLLTP